MLGTGLLSTHYVRIYCSWDLMFNSYLGSLCVSSTSLPIWAAFLGSSTLRTTASREYGRTPGIGVGCGRGRGAPKPILRRSPGWERPPLTLGWAAAWGATGPPLVSGAGELMTAFPALRPLV